ncbi:GNAT family N-acetyltransferase [Bifidobacterium avesanii]|uniref:GNAT family N-acetyltransferase n=1 Tax=Bifidobacterium avesanii TaxID=1798157 RepID=A0A7K3TH05_9BIFI|nr:GNAT family N-acetyltransferase [Bifidobacterium avesanii]KAB8292763.1 acetyltransferase [Bifidobacterium avesanii]NEG78371.1 GNAT family N-acetyltransferase [Bifidobacterium avesanii]
MTTPTQPQSSPTQLHIRRAENRDIPELHRLLREVLEVHHNGRPDLFKTGATKYTNDELAGILASERTPVFGAFAPDDATLLGYAFCIFQRHENSNILTDVLTLYIDDICVDESARGRHVGAALYRHVIDFARAAGCHNVTLNVWSCNPGSQAFYERMGLKPYKVGMEQLL